MIAPAAIDEETFAHLLAHVREARGIDFTRYKRSTLGRRLAKRMNAAGARTPGEYLERLRGRPEELAPLIDTLFVNVTGFFRDPAAWEALRAHVLPAVLAAAGEEPVRVWCAGVATGEEVYTLAMLMAELMGRERYLSGARIFATDLDEGALLRARAAIYPAEALQAVPAELRERYFGRCPRGAQFRPAFRRPVVFGRHDLLQDPAISRVHLLLCRNTVMYFTREAQAAVLARLHSALRPHGYLFLGKAEMLLSQRSLFVAEHGRARLFRKISDAPAPTGALGRAPT